MLGRVIRGDTDPHSYTASIFYDMQLSEFVKLKQTNPIEFNEKRSLAKFMNFSILSGVGVDKLLEQIRISQTTST